MTGKTSDLLRVGSGGGFIQISYNAIISECSPNDLTSCFLLGTLFVFLIDIKDKTSPGYHEHICKT